MQRNMQSRDAPPLSAEEDARLIAVADELKRYHDGLGGSGKGSEIDAKS